MNVQAEHLYKAYGGTPVLEDVSLELGAGVTCLMGLSGRGKTTLLRLLLGLEMPDGGVIRGLETARCAAVFQEDRLLEHLDAAGNLRFVLGAAYDPAEAAELLGELGLSGAAGKPARALSGGMRRRLALARALSVPFDFLALDEPFAGLDGETRRQALACLRARTEGKTVLLVTHDSADAEALGAGILRL